MSSFPLFCICCLYHLIFIISLFCSLNYSLHFTFFFINALSCIGSLFKLSRSFFNALSCIRVLSFPFHMLFLYPVFFSFALSHIFLHIRFYFLLVFIFSSYLFLFFTLQLPLLLYLFFLCVSLQKTTLNMCLGLSYIVHYIPT